MDRETLKTLETPLSEIEKAELLDAIPHGTAHRMALRRVFTQLDKTVAELARVEQAYNDIVDIDLARRQLPDGTVPGNTVECARGWHRAYNELFTRWTESRERHQMAEKLMREERAVREAAEAEVARLRAALVGLKRVYCFCDGANVKPQFGFGGRHTSACLDASAALAPSTDGRPTT